MSSRTIPGKLVLRALEMEGYLLRATMGKHMVFAGSHGGNLVIIQADGEVPRMHIGFILDAAGISRERFLENIAKGKLEPRRRYTLLGTILAKPIPDVEANKRQRIAPIEPAATGKSGGTRKK